jgi:serine/threonine protein kinase
LPGDPNQNPENEKDLLDQLVELRNPNITVPLAAWEQSGIFYMLFPKAECSLKTFLNEQSAPSTSDETFLQLVQQLINLSHALDSIHNLRGPLVGAQTQRTNEPQQADSQGLTVPLDRLTIRQQTGYHHDLKPDNILIFPGGMWTINDFGTARIHEAVANSSYRTPNLNGGEATYAPPDYESRGESSRPYDIWSLGCIFLEVLIWLFSSGSGKGLADFATQRMLDEGESVGVTGAFWHMKEGRPKLRPSVKKQFEQLKMDAKDKSQFLTLVNLTEKMLSPDSNRRPEAGQIRSRLEAMQQEALRFLSRGKEESRNTEPMYYPATLHSQGRTVEDGQSSPADMDEYEGSGDSQLSPRIGRKRRLSSVSNDGNLERSMGRPRLESLFLPGAQAAGALLSSPGRASPVPSIVLDGAAIFDEDLESHDSVLPPDMKLEDFR